MEFATNLLSRTFKLQTFYRGRKSGAFKSVRKTRSGHAHACQSYVGHAIRTGCGGGLENGRTNDEFYFDLYSPSELSRTQIVNYGSQKIIKIVPKKTAEKRVLTEIFLFRERIAVR